MLILYCDRPGITEAAVLGNLGKKLVLYTVGSATGLALTATLVFAMALINCNVRRMRRKQHGLLPESDFGGRRNSIPLA